MVTDIMGAFLHADMNKTVHMILEGTLAEHIVKLQLTIYQSDAAGGTTILEPIGQDARGVGVHD